MLEHPAFEQKEVVLPDGSEHSYFFSDSWSEIGRLFSELQELNKLENEFRAAEFMKGHKPVSHTPNPLTLRR